VPKRDDALEPGRRHGLCWTGDHTSRNIGKARGIPRPRRRDVRQLWNVTVLRRRNSSRRRSSNSGSMHSNELVVVGFELLLHARIAGAVRNRSSGEGCG
jgi:hypothetical protein